MRAGTTWLLTLTAAMGTIMLISRSSVGAPTPTTTQPAAAESPRPLTTLGHELIEGLPPIRFGLNQERFLEAQRNEKIFATSRSSLVSTGTGESLRYYYQDVSIFRGDDRRAMEVRTTGVLNRRFRPEKIEWEIINQAPNGTFTKATESLTIDDEEMLHVKTDATGKTIEKRIPTPKEDFVYLVDDLLLMLKLEPGQMFILSDLDPDTGRLNRRTYEVSKKDGNLTRVSIRKHPSKVETEYYLLREPGTIMRHDLHDLSISFTATTETRVIAAEKAVRRVRQ